MEGQKVGTGKSSATTLDNEGLDLLWPSELVKERSALRRQRPWSPALAIASLIFASIIALGPVQLILMAITQDFPLVTEVYFPVALRVCLMLTGVLAIAIIIAIVRAWYEQPSRSTMVATAGIGAVVIGATVWLDAFVLHLSANQLTIFLILIIISAWIAVYASIRRTFSTDRPVRSLAISFASILVFGLAEIAMTGVYLFSQTSTA